MPFDDDEFEAALKGSSSNLNAQQGQAILLSSSSPLKGKAILPWMQFIRVDLNIFLLL